MPVAALRSILDAAGLPGSRARTVAFSGGADPVLATPYRIGAAGSAALAATGLAAADLWERRTGRQQSVGVDLRAATASLRSATYLRLNGGRMADLWEKLSGIYPTRDGRWIYFHTNFPNHRDAALKVLGAAADADAVRRAAATWDAAPLEEALIAAGGAGGMVRSAAEWSAHPQASAVAALPLLEILRIGDSPPEPLPAGDRPLSGIQVLDLTRVLAGPTCARSLAEHGAEVLKINAAHLPSSGTIEWDTGIGKRAAYLDLRNQGDLDTLRDLIRSGDVFSQSYRPEALARRGLSPEALAALRPGIVHVTLSAFGHEGPWAGRRGFDTVVQAVTGWAVSQGQSVPIGSEMPAAQRPRFLPVSAIDYVSGYLMAFGAMVALARRAEEGGSWLVRVSLAQIGRWIADLGTVPDAGLAGLADDLTPEEVASWTAEIETEIGTLRHLAPVLQLSETPPFAARTPVPLGHDLPSWPERLA